MYRPEPGTRPDRILAALREHPEGLTAQQLTAITDPGIAAHRPDNAVRVQLHRMARRGLVQRKGACRYPVMWQMPPAERAPQQSPHEDRGDGVIMRKPAPPPPNLYASHPAPCAHRLLEAVLAEMPPVRPGALTGTRLSAWHDVMTAIVKAVYSSDEDLGCS
jgi:hypothetical protein